MKSTLIDVIENQILSDDCNRITQSERLLAAYRESTDPASIDRLMISLCGWSMETLQRQARTGLRPISMAEAIRQWPTTPLYRLFEDDTEGQIESEDELIEAIQDHCDLGIDSEIGGSDD